MTCKIEVTAPAPEVSKQPAEKVPDEEEEEEEMLKLEGTDPSVAVDKKKKKKKKKPSNAPTGTKSFNIPEQDNSVFRLVSNWKACKNSQQSPNPPSCPVRHSPVGEILHYPNRTVSEEARQKEKLLDVDYQNIRRAAECHRNVRKYAQSYIRPGMKMIDICQRLEAKTLELIEASGLDSGWGFPTGCSLNHVAAHYTPNHGDNTTLQASDICKLDFGVHVGGRIIDSAFTIAFDAKFDPLIQATKDGTNAGLREAGIDARFSEIGQVIQEAIESYEMDVGNGKIVPVRAIRNLNGHSIEPYRIHGGKSVPIVKNADCGNLCMEEGEFYAIETFASTGKAYVVEDMECSHYMKSFDAQAVPLRNPAARTLLNHIDKTFDTLPFCRRWLDDGGQTRHIMALKALCDVGIVNQYPPLVDVKGSFISQMEHTIMIRPTCKEIVSRGEDY